jgi:hypothetical protein
MRQPPLAVSVIVYVLVGGERHPATCVSGKMARCHAQPEMTVAARTKNPCKK